MATIIKNAIAYISIAELSDMLISNKFTVNADDMEIIPRIILLQDSKYYESHKDVVDMVNTILMKAHVARIHLNSITV